MSNYLYGPNDRFYLARSTSYSTARNSAGASTVAAGDACHHKNFLPKPMRGRLAASDKESTAFLGYMDHSRRGRYSATASVSLPLYSGSGAGVEPDHGPLLESWLGKRTIVADTSVTYGAAAQGSNPKYMDESAPITCEMWGFNPVGQRGMVLVGGLVNRLRMSGGQNDVAIDADLVAYYALSQDRFANAITAEKMGLTAWPSEPGTQTYTGAEETGFITSITIDTVDFTDLLRNWAITGNMNRSYRTVCGTDGTEFFPANPYEMMPEFLADLSFHNCDASKLTTFAQRVANRTPQDVVIQLGATAGGIQTLNFNNLLKPEDDEPVNEDGDDNRKALTVSGLRAQATSTSARDEITCVLT